MLRRLLFPNRPQLSINPYPGHFALMKSVVEGLGSVGTDFNYSHKYLSDLFSVVYTQENNSLRQAIKLKQIDKIGFLAEGPVNGMFKEEGYGLIDQEEIDMYIVVSGWVHEYMARKFPHMADKLVVLPVGIDTEDWRPVLDRQRKGYLVYVKTESPIVDDVTRYLSTKRIDYAVVRYGEYGTHEYKLLLNSCEAMIYLSESETQGIALAEAWSMGVPTFVWDPQTEADWRGIKFISGSSCPYLTPATGQSWKTLDELIELIEQFDPDAVDLDPRAWVVANMGMDDCALRIYDTILQRAARA